MCGRINHVSINIAMLKVFVQFVFELVKSGMMRQSRRRATSAAPKSDSNKKATLDLPDDVAGHVHSL